MATEGRVVVLVKPTVLYNERDSVYAAQFLELGLLTYDTTAAGALDKLTKMFAGAVKARRALGKLARWLNDCNVEWYWENDYKQPALVIDADSGVRVSPNNWREIDNREPIAA